MSKTNSLKRSLKKAKLREKKQRARITKNLLKNCVCENCDHYKKVEWGSYRGDIGKSFCSNQLYVHLYRTNKIPKENTCRLWIEDPTIKHI